MSESNNKLAGKLDFLVGIWQTSGETISTGSDPVISISGTDTYEWVLNGKFMQHRADVKMGDKHVELIEMIGKHPAENGNYEMRSYDNEGNVEMMKGSLTCEGTLLIEGAEHRATLTAAEDGKSMHARWEQLAGNEWHHWMDMRFTKKV